MSPPPTPESNDSLALLENAATAGGIRMLAPWAFGKLQPIKKLAEIFRTGFLLGGALQFFVGPLLTELSKGKWDPQLPWYGTMAVGLLFFGLETYVSNHQQAADVAELEVIKKNGGTNPPAPPG